MANSNRYWAKRQAEKQAALLAAMSSDIDALMQTVYIKASENLIDSLIALYARIMANPNPTANTCAQYIRKYKMLDKVIKEMTGVDKALAKLMRETLESGYLKASQVTAEGLADKGIISGNELYSKVNEKRAQAAAEAIWAADGKNWSARLWGNTQALKDKLLERLPVAVANGESSLKLTSELMNDFSVSYSNARRLANTELAHIMNDAAIDRMADAGIKEWEWMDAGTSVTIKGNGVCKVCSEMNGKRFPITDKEHMPPDASHPYCRCTVVAVIE